LTSNKQDARVTSHTVTKAPTETSTREQQLTWQEEMTVRMAHGLSEDREHALEFRGQLHGELRARLSAMEAELLEVMFQRGPLAVQEAVDEPAVDTDARARIVEQLARLRKTDSES